MCALVRSVLGVVRSHHWNSSKTFTAHKAALICTTALDNPCILVKTLICIAASPDHTVYSCNAEGLVHSAASPRCAAYRGNARASICNSVLVRPASFTLFVIISMIHTCQQGLASDGRARGRELASARCVGVVGDEHSRVYTYAHTQVTDL